MGNGSKLLLPNGLSFRINSNTAVLRLHVALVPSGTTGNVLVMGSSDQTLATAASLEGSQWQVTVVLASNAIALRGNQYVQRIEGTGTVYVLDSSSYGSKASTVTVVTVGTGGSGPTYTAGTNIDLSGNAISTKVATPSGTALVFTQDAEYPAISSGTFSVDATGAKVGSVVRVRLAAGTSAPTLPSGFTKLAGSFDASKLNVFSFCVCADGTIDYYVTTL